MTMPLLLAVLLAAQSAGSGGGIANVPMSQSGSPAPVTPRPAAIQFLRVVYDELGGTPATAFYSRSQDFTAYIHTVDTICGAGRDGQTRPTDAAFGWEITGKFVSRTPSEVIVRLDWHRAWEQGRPVTEPSGSMNLALHPGERVPIDRITTTAIPGKCRGVGMTLSVEFSNGASMVGVAASGGGTSGGGGGRVGSTGTGGAFGGSGGGGRAGTGGGGGTGAPGSVFGSGSGGGRSGGAITLSPEERSAQVRDLIEQLSRTTAGQPGSNSSVRIVSASGNGQASVVSDLDPRTLQTVTAEIWLVHRLPSGTEESQFLTVQTVPGSGTFEFPAVPLTFSGSAYAVDVKGFIQAQRLSDGAERLEVGLVRRVTLLGATPRGISVGSTAQKVAMPQRGQVVSLEMPAFASDHAELGGHQFSLRIRVPR